MPASTSKLNSNSYLHVQNIFFFFQEVKVNLANRTELKKYIQSIFRKEGKKLESINYIFCTDKILLEINLQYLSHDFYTDIISFDLSETNAVRAEIFISVDRVKENALQLGVSFKSELHRVVFHGALHLCGYKDKTKTEKEKMRRMEELYLAKYF